MEVDSEGGQGPTWTIKSVQRENCCKKLTYMTVR
jgi:hypothetical protein